MKEERGMSGTPAKNGGRRRRLAVMIVALAASVAILLAALMGGAHAQDTEPEPNHSDEAPPVLPRSMSGGGLVIPVFPRLEEKKDPSDDSEPKLPAGADLRDSYIILKDGSVLSAADWIKGGLIKNQTGVGMSDYQNRLFLGQVARAMAGVDENQVNHSVVTVGPLRPYEPAMISEPMQMVHGIFRMFVPGSNGYEWNPATSGGGFDRRRATAGDAAVQFEGQFSAAVSQTAADFQEIGTMMNMLSDYKKKHGID